MFKTIQSNIISGLLVSLIALPLCLAIATASDFPVLAGIITAIVGGLVVSQLSGSFVTINGPAAGMIAIILDCVARLGKGDIFLGYKYVLAAIVVSSILQIITSFSKVLNFMRKFPEEIIRGMMVAIGIIIIIKQSFNLFGYAPPKHSYTQLILDIPLAFLGMQIEAFIIGIITIIFILWWQKKIKYGFLNKIPVYIVAIILAAVLSAILNLDMKNHFLITELASKPKSLFINISQSIFSTISFPNFDKFFTLDFAISVFAIYSVGSIETILSAIAVDKLDPQKRTTDLAKDLRAVGIGNLICGLIGGLPMIAEIVRSSANIKYGATNKWSNFCHGLFLLVFVGLFSNLIKFIPFCALAAMLILVGINLINFRLIKTMYQESKSSILVIFSVVIFTLTFDLLLGVLAGILVYNILHKINNRNKA